MAEAWYHLRGQERVGPEDLATLRGRLAGGALGAEALAPDTLVWREGLAAWVPASSVAELASVVAPPPAPGPAAPLPAAPAQSAPQRGLLEEIGSRVSAIAGVDEVRDVPVRSVLMSGLDGVTQPQAAEDVFAVGTSATTPPLCAVPAGWPRPRVFWRILVGALATYMLLRVGVTEFHNPKFLPGLIVVGAFGVPLAVVTFFFEMNTPRNVSVYQVGRMVGLGGAIALVATMVLSNLAPGAGAGRLLPALLTGVVEETAKVLGLLLIVGAVRFPWQLNGMLFGAAVGAGFAGFESAGYAAEAGDLFGSIMWRAILAPGGHVIWTAMIAGAIWQVRGAQAFRLEMLVHPVVVRRWAVAVGLHGLWNALLVPSLELVIDAVLLLVGWYITFAIFKRAFAEVDAARAAQAAASAPAPTAAG
jgi:RsiW-degrading membrane proteinase PrsW (M82 family)